MACDMTMPLGSPVLPEVYCTMAASESLAWWVRIQGLRFRRQGSGGRVGG